MLFLKQLKMMQQFALRESREAQDPHRAMRLDIDNMSYEVEELVFAYMPPTLET